MGADISRGRQRFAAYCDWSAVFLWQLNFFQLFFYARCGRKKRREKRLKKRRGRFPKALRYIGIQCRKSAGRKKNAKPYKAYLHNLTINLTINLWLNSPFTFSAMTFWCVICLETNLRSCFTVFKFDLRGFIQWRVNSGFYTTAQSHCFIFCEMWKL